MTASFSTFVNRRFSRRNLLQGLGATAALAPFVPVLETRAAGGPPLRLLVMMSGCGTIPDAWSPNGTPEDFSFGEILSPLEGVKEHIVVLEGLDFNSGGAGNKHLSGPAKFTCGTGLLEGSEFGGGSAPCGWGAGTSIDQAYARESGLQTPFRSLELGVRVTGSSPRTRLAYSGPGEPVPPENDPTQVFDRLFASFDEPSNGNATRLRAERRSVLDVIKEQTDGLNQKIGRDDRLKIETHLEGLREIEKRLDLAPTAGHACAAPTLGEPLDHMSTAAFPAVSRLQLDLLTMAFACDLTRAATFLWSGSTSDQTFPWLGISDSHHDLSHDGDSDDSARNKLVKINRWYAEEFAYLVARLRDIPEDGGSMLDNTLVIWGNELGKGNSHSQNNVPLVFAGGRNAGITTGRYLKFNGIGHNRLLVSLLNAVGIDVDRYGENEDGSGPLAGF